MLTPPARTRVLVPDVAITKRHSPEFVIGTPSTYTIEVRNAGGAPTVGEVRVADAAGGPHARRRDGARVDLHRTAPLVCTRTTRSRPEPTTRRSSSSLAATRLGRAQQHGHRQRDADGDAGNNSYTELALPPSPSWT